MKVAITGANGFLGQYLVDTSLSAGHEVFALVRKSAETSVFQKHDSLTICPVDYKNINDEFKSLEASTGGIDFFIHNAGKTTSINRADYTNINTKLTGEIVSTVSEVNLLKTGGKFVYISSYTAHGPIGVNHPVSCYGESKRQAEQHILSSGLASVIFRPTAIYGAGDKAFLPLFQAANKGIYPLTRPAQKMSMIHAADLAAIVVGGMADKEGIFHVSDGNTYLHSEFRDTLSVVLNRKIRNIRIPSIVSKISLGLSDVWYSVTRGTPNLTLEKFEEISQDWDLHDEETLSHANGPIEFDLKKGFENAYKFYAKNKML
ncbi:MAG: SDR family NAD(P)-dependent oxidoreductase [Cyclobacteriaceae bacterium]